MKLQADQPGRADQPANDRTAADSSSTDQSTDQSTDRSTDQPTDQPAADQLRRSREWGRIEVLPEVVGAVAAHAALECYGVHGMAARGLRDGFAELLRRDSLHRGVDVREAPGGLIVDVYVVVQFGVRITEVAHNLQAAVRFDVERTVGVPVVEVNVNVQGVYEP